MAKNIEMNYFNGTSYEVYYPKTLSDNIIITDVLATKLGASSGSSLD